MPESTPNKSHETAWALLLIRQPRLQDESKMEEEERGGGGGGEGVDLTRGPEGSLRRTRGKWAPGMIDGPSGAASPHQ